LIKKYSLIDHTADFGIQVFGKNPAELFANAAFAIFDLITDIRKVTGKNKKKVFVTSSDWPDLMVNWLRELLYLWNGNEMLVKEVDIHSISEKRLSATVFYEPYDSDHHVIKMEIKAVTYHQIQVAPTPRRWETRIIFDV
jgi:SHS2 domain-containing protein